MAIKLEVGQLVRNGKMELKVRAIEKETVVFERLNFELFGSIEYIVGKHPSVMPPSTDDVFDLPRVTWYLGKYFYKLEDALAHAGAHIKVPTEGIKLPRYRGTWYVIDEAFIRGGKYYLLESEIYGDEVPCMIVGRYHDVIMDNVYNGFDDLRELLGVD